jgi:hypothetical protein
MGFALALSFFENPGDTDASSPGWKEVARNSWGFCSRDMGMPRTRPRRNTTISSPATRGHARLAACQSRTGYAPDAATHPINALARKENRPTTTLAARNLRFPAVSDRRELNPSEGGQAMVARKLIVFFVVVMFPLGLLGLSFAAGMGELKGLSLKLKAAS